MRILLRDIYIGERQRKDYGVADLKDLREDLETNGQIQPIAVRPPNDSDRAEEEYDSQPWVLIAGGRRCAAAYLLGWTDIEGFTREEMSTLTANILELHENIKRKAMSWQEIVKAKEKLLELRREEDPNISQIEIARELGQDPGEFSKDLKASRILKENPGLNKASSRFSALAAGKILEENKSKRLAATDNPARFVESLLGGLEDRVQTADALKFVSALPENSIDLTLIDAPYGYSYKPAGGGTGASSNALTEFNDTLKNITDQYDLLLPELVRTTRLTGWIVAFCGKETYDYVESKAKDLCAEHYAYRSGDSNTCLGEINSPCRFLVPEPFPWIWYRPNSRNNPRNKFLHAKNMMELILVINLGKGNLVEGLTPNVKVHDNDYGGSRLHTSQKPLSLYKELIQNFTLVGDSVLDCFFGSANSLVAASSLGRVPYGCDNNPELIEVAHGNIRSNTQFISKEQMQESYNRFLKRVNDPYPEEDPPETARPSGEWTYELLRIGTLCLAYVRYSGHLLVQFKGNDMDKIEDEAQACCEIMQSIVILKLLDPQSCSPEEATQAYQNFLAADEEESTLQMETPI